LRQTTAINEAVIAFHDRLFARLNVLATNESMYYTECLPYCFVFIVLILYLICLLEASLL